MEIRPAALADLPSLSALWQERMVLLCQGDARFGRHRLTPAQWQSSKKNRICEAGGVLIMAVSESHTPAGYITGYIHPEQDAGIIDEIALDAHSYHAGAGRLLVTAVRDWFGQHHINRIFVQAPRYHAVEQAFWRALGASPSTEAPCTTPPEFNWMIL